MSLLGHGLKSLGTTALKDASHPNHGLFILLRGSRLGTRYRSLTWSTNRTKNSFFPSAVRLLNSLPPHKAHWGVQAPGVSVGTRFSVYLSIYLYIYNCSSSSFLSLICSTHYLLCILCIQLLVALLVRSFLISLFVKTYNDNKVYLIWSMLGCMLKIADLQALFQLFSACNQA